MSVQHSPKTTAAERAAAAKRRSQALIGAGAGAAVIAVLIAIFVVVRSADDKPVAAPAAAASAAAGDPGSAQPTPEAPAQPPAEPPAQPGGIATPPALKTEPVVKGGTGEVSKLKVTSIVKGTGPALVKGQQIAVNYTGVNYKTGKQFDSSWKRGQPYVTQIGVGAVIPGWDQGLVGVPVGSRVQLDIPAELAYGDRAPDSDTAGALRFVVDIIAAK